MLRSREDMHCRNDAGGKEEGRAPECNSLITSRNGQGQTWEKTIRMIDDRTAQRKSSRVAGSLGQLRSELTSLIKFR